jgi:hypothetical protein
MSAPDRERDDTTAALLLGLVAVVIYVVPKLAGCFS